MSTDRTPAHLAGLATAHSVVGFTACACLLIFYTVGEPFGILNDLANATLATLTIPLAHHLPTTPASPATPPAGPAAPTTSSGPATPATPSGPAAPATPLGSGSSSSTAVGVLFGMVVVGAAVSVVGTVLVVSEITGFYLAGLWSGFGFGLIGVWLVGISLRDAVGLRRAGLIAGGVMLLGLIGIPGIVLGLDDMGSAPPWAFAAGVSWAGTYLLFPAWSLRLARKYRPERIS